MAVQCPFCNSQQVFKAGFRVTGTGERIQRYLCRLCGRRFSFKPLLRNEVKVNIGAKPVEALDPAENLADGLNLNPASSEPGFEDSALPVREDVGPHASTIVGKGLNRLLSYDSKRRRSERVPPTGSENMNPNEGDGEKALVLATGERPGQARTRIQADPELISFAFWLKKKGRSESTIKGYCSMLNMLSKQGANLNDPESVKEVLAKNGKSDRWKELAIAACDAYFRMKGLTWEKPRIQTTRKIPFIPTEQELDVLIAGCGPKTSALLQLLKETGMRIGEALRLKWVDIDFERKVVILNEPEKNSNSRVFRVSDKLIGMLSRFPRKGERVFTMLPGSAKATFKASRKMLAEKLNNPRLLRITFHTFRHWKATMEYHRTKDSKG